MVNLAALIFVAHASSVLACTQDLDRGHVVRTSHGDYSYSEENVEGSDGHVHNISELSINRPVFFVYFAGFSGSDEEQLQRRAIRDMNRLDRELQGKVQVVGALVQDDATNVRRFARAMGARFLMLNFVSYSEVLSVKVQPVYSPVRDLSNWLLYKGRRVGVWFDGYNQSTLREMEKAVLRSANVSLKLDLLHYPTKMIGGSYEGV